LILRFVLEQPTRAIGEVMRRSEDSVRGLQLRALESLRAELEAQGERR
jgi:DNA-directed RNA polymerase specialized sigma24 family protein